MRILNPGKDEQCIYIPKNNVYVYVNDFGLKFMLKEIKIDIGQHTWYWIDMREDKYIDISEIKGVYCTFENAINRAVNNPYSTVYQFESYAAAMGQWEEIKYVDEVKTVYKGEEKSNE